MLSVWWTGFHSRGWQVGWNGYGGLVTYRPLDLTCGGG